MSFCVTVGASSEAKTVVTLAGTGRVIFYMRVGSRESDSELVTKPKDSDLTRAQNKQLGPRSTHLPSPFSSLVMLPQIEKLAFAFAFLSVSSNVCLFGQFPCQFVCINKAI